MCRFQTKRLLNSVSGRIKGHTNKVEKKRDEGLDQCTVLDIIRTYGTVRIMERPKARRPRLITWSSIGKQLKILASASTPKLRYPTIAKEMDIAQLRAVEKALVFDQAFKD